MKITLEDGEILYDHELKAFVESLSSALGYERSVQVSVIDNAVTFELLTIEQEAALEEKG